MKLVYAVNYVEGNRNYPKHKLIRELQCQLENSLAIGWNPKDIIVMSNFDYEFYGVTSTLMEFPKYCLTGSKMFAMEELFKRDMVDDIICCHDLDAWQNDMFDPPSIRDIGISTYSTPKFNGGVIFYRPTAKDIVLEIASILHKDKPKQEEPTINKVLKSDKYQKRTTVLHTGWNIGCSGFVERYLRAGGDIKFAHVHPLNRIGMDTHTCDRNNLGMNYVTMGPRLYNLIKRYFYPDSKYPPKPQKTNNKPNTFKPDRSVSDKNPHGKVIGPAIDPNSEKKWPTRELTEKDPLPDPKL
jgi:hypothetical protein